MFEGIPPVTLELLLVYRYQNFPLCLVVASTGMFSENLHYEIDGRQTIDRTPCSLEKKKSNMVQVIITNESRTIL